MKAVKPTTVLRKLVESAGFSPRNLQAFFQNTRKGFYKRHRLEVDDKRAISFFRQSSCNEILDVGCGNGRFLKLCMEHGFKALGLERNPETIHVVAEANDPPLVNGDALSLPFHEQSFSGVHCSHLIEHFPPDEAYRLLEELGRVLAIGGVLIIRTPLLWKHFYDDFTHVKPYYPNALLSYLCHRGGQHSRNSMQHRFELIRLIYRYLPLYYRQPASGQPRSLLIVFFDFLYKFGIHNPLRRDGYMCVFRKVG